MLVSRQAWQEQVFTPNKAQPKNADRAITAAVEPVVEVNESDIDSLVSNWSKECSGLSDVSGFVRQIAPANVVQVEEYHLGIELDASHLDDRNLELVQLAFAKLLSIYAGETKVAYALLEQADQTRQDAWLLRHCVVELGSGSVNTTAPLPLDSLARHLDGRKLWGASFSINSNNAHVEERLLKHLPLSCTSLHLQLSLDADHRVGVRAVYAADTLLASDAEQICKRMVHLLTQLHRQVPLDQLDAFVPGERELILGTLGRSQQLFESTGSKTPVLVHKLISLASQRFRSSIAVQAPSKVEITYEQLGTSSGRLACQLRRLGVAPEVHVAMMLEKSELLPISILAILKAGGCVTPMVDQLTDDRICHIMNETRPPVWIIDAFHAPRAEQIASSLTDEIRPQLLRVSPDLHSSKEPLLDLIALRDVKILPTTKAYTIYTSGSTGVPKAVILEHRNLASFAAAKMTGWNPSPGSRLLQFSAPVWDVSVGDFIYALTTGATLVLQDRFAAITDIDATIDELHITHAILTPTVADFIRQRHASLQALILTGEPVPLAQRDRLLPLVPSLLNGGAPSEVTILALMNQLDPEETNLRWTPFGRPIGSVECMIVDSSNALAPIGGVGELYLTGEQVSRGYLNQPEKTASVFVDLSIYGASKRFYRTGDFARLHADGRFELLGRMDGQLKYRGVRLEAQEIQDAIERADERIQNAFVCTRTIKETARLVALVQMNANEKLEDKAFAQQLADHVRAKLGSAATPNVFIFTISGLPLTVSGKLDRKALQRLVDDSIASGKLHVVTSSTKPACQQQEEDKKNEAIAFATGKAQITVAEAFGAVLDLDSHTINIHDSLDELGGDSLSAVRILTHLRKRGAKVEIRDLVQGGGTIAIVAARACFNEDSSATTLTKVDPKLAELDAMDRDWVMWRYAIDPDWIEDMFYSTPYQGVSAGMGFAYKLARPQSIEWNQAVWECKGPRINADKLRSAWMNTIQHHANFRSGMAYTARFRGVVCIFKQKHCPFDLKTFYPRTDKEHDRDFHGYMDEDRLLGHVEFGRVPFRLALIGATANRVQKLIISFPHSLADGWSMRLMLQDLLCHLNGHPSQVSPLPTTSFKEYIAFTRSRDVDQLASWWEEELKQLHYVKWPIDYESKPETLPVVNRQYDSDLFIDTKALAKSSGVSLFTVTMTAFVLALARRSTTTENQSRVQVTTSYIASSRFFDGLEDLDSIRGPTLDVLLGLFQVDLDDNVETLLRHCYETISRSKGKEHSPLDRLSSTLGISKVRSGLQTSMIFQNLPSLKPSLNDEQEITMELGREHMATSSCIFLQVTPSKDKLTFRTAFDDRLVSSDEAHRLVDDMRCLIQIMASMKERPARELMSAVPERAKAIAELPRPQPLELFDLTPVNGGYWIRRLLRNLWWMFWYHLVLWPIRKRRL